MDEHISPSLAEPSYVERLRHRGVRVTPQRVIVLEALAAHPIGGLPQDDPRRA